MNTLEEPVHAARAQEWRAVFARALDEQRERAQSLFQARREKFASLQTELSIQLTALADELARQQAEALERDISLDSEQTALEAKRAGLRRQGDELTAQYSQWEEAQASSRAGQQGLLAVLQERLVELDLRHDEIEAAQRELQTQRAECIGREAAAAESLAEFDAQKTAVEEQSRQLSQLQSGLARERAELDHQRQALQQREQAAQRQRRSIARQLRTRKAELVAELELLRQEASAVPGQDFDWQLRCSELQGKCDRLREEAAEFSQHREDWQERLSAAQQQLAQRQGEWSQSQKQWDETQARLKELEAREGEFTRERDQLIFEKMRLGTEGEHLRAELRAASASANDQVSTGQEASAELQRLRDEIKQLEEWLAESEVAVETAKSAAAAATSQELTEIRRRLEIATSDCRDLQARNTALQDQLTKARSSSPPSAAAPPFPAGPLGMGWEAQKQRMLAQLEADHDASDPAQKAQRVTIENALQITAEALAAKDVEVRDIRREVEDLRSLLENQSSSIGQFAVGATAFAGMLDKDELVRQERESLQKIQESVREQLKKAEIDISLERAKIARDRADLDEQLHALKREKDQQTAADPASGGEKGKPPRGRWLSRLGLSDGK